MLGNSYKMAGELTALQGEEGAMGRPRSDSGGEVISLIRLPVVRRPLDDERTQKPPIRVPPGAPMTLVSEEDLPISPTRPPYSTNLRNAG
jgi:hypothetical protein